LLNHNSLVNSISVRLKVQGVLRA